MLSYIANIATAAVALIAVGALVLNYCAFRANTKAFQANAKATDAASYTKLADRIDDAYDDFRRIRRQYKARVGVGRAERRYAAERLLAVIADSCHLYLSGLLLDATREMVGEYLDTMLPLQYKFLRKVAGDPGDGSPYRYIRKFGEHRENKKIVGQFPPGPLPHSEVAGTIVTVRTSNASIAKKLAFEFMVLTARRSDEVRLARWDDVDLEAGKWTIPAAHTKAQRPHRVPLSGRAVEILDKAKKKLGGDGPVFPSSDGSSLSGSTLSTLLRGLRIAAVPDGFRSSFKDWCCSFKDWCCECSNARREVAEAALAHVVRDKGEAVDAHPDLFKSWRGLMDDWAAYVAPQRRGLAGLVDPLRSQRMRPSPSGAEERGREGSLMTR